MSNGLADILCLMDDILILENTRRNTIPALERIQAAGVTLSKDKCEFNKTSLITFLGHTINGKGISCNLQKTFKMGSSSTTELRCFMGMVNHLGKFSQIAELSKPMRVTQLQMSLELGTSLPLLR